MRIKHIHGDLEFELTFREWRTKYLNSDKYKNYEIVNLNNVVELHVVDEETGVMRFSQVIDKKEAENNVRQFSKTQYIKPLSYKYCDENLMSKKNDYSGLSFFTRLKKALNSIPTLKDIKQKIINSTTSKLLGKFIFISLVTIISGLLILLIWKLYETKLNV
jgi:hypothetical protein